MNGTVILLWITSSEFPAPCILPPTALYETQLPLYDPVIGRHTLICLGIDIEPSAIIIIPPWPFDGILCLSF